MLNPAVVLCLFVCIAMGFRCCLTD